MAKRTKKAETAGGTAVAEIPIKADSVHTELSVESVPIDQISVKGKADRTRDEAFKAGIIELAANISNLKLQQPIAVKGSTQGGSPLELIFGERRLLACKHLGWEFIPAIVATSDAQVAEIRAAENMHREDLNDDQKALVIGDLVAVAEARVVIEMRGQVELKSGDVDGLDAPSRDAVRTQACKRVAERFGWPVQRVRDYAFIGELPAKTRALGAAGRLSIGHMKALAVLPDAKDIDRLAEEYASHGDGEPMRSLDDLRSEVGGILGNLGKATWDLDTPFAGGPACRKCTSNSLNRTGLFEGLGKQWVKDPGQQHAQNQTDVDKAAASGGVCSNLTCFKAKGAAAKASVRGAGDRIAKALQATPAKEREAKLGEMVREATARAKFIPATVFGREVRERIKTRLNAKTKKGGSSRASGYSQSSYDSPAAKAKQMAESRHAEETKKRNRPIRAHIRSELKALPLGNLRTALVGIAIEHTLPGGAACKYNQDKASAAAVNKLKPVLRTCISGTVEEAFKAIVDLDHQVGRILPDDWSDLRATALIDLLVAELKLGDYPAVPTLETFIAEEKAKLAPKPESKKSKTSPPGKSRGEKKPAGKKKAKKSKTSAKPAPDAPAFDDSMDDEAGFEE